MDCERIAPWNTSRCLVRRQLIRRMLERRWFFRMYFRGVKSIRRCMPFSKPIERKGSSDGFQRDDLQKQGKG